MSVVNIASECNRIRAIIVMAESVLFINKNEDSRWSLVKKHLDEIVRVMETLKNQAQSNQWDMRFLITKKYIKASMINKINEDESKTICPVRNSWRAVLEWIETEIIVSKLKMKPGKISEITFARCADYINDISIYTTSMYDNYK